MLVAMRFALVEMPARFGDPSAQVRRLDAILERAQGAAEVVLLPEACLTGYVSSEGDFDLGPFAEPIDVGPTSVAMARLSKRSGVWLGWPLVERAPNGRLYNTYCVSDPSGARVARYRKRHPWYPETWATPGEAPHATFQLGSLEATIAICFDVHFLAEENPAALREADVLLFPSAWVEERGDDLRGPLLSELAQAFGVSILNPNWGPGDVVLHGQGSSRVVTPDGELARNRADPYIVVDVEKRKRA